MFAKLVCWAQGRSTQWPAVRRVWLADHPQCFGCGTTENVEVHHITPFSQDKSKELDSGNLVTLCEKPGHDCHFHFGHLLNWQSWNRHVLSDALAFRQAVSKRP